MSLSHFSGSCLCDKVKYSIDAEVDNFYFCHCKQCRKLTGGPLASNIQLKPTDVNWLSGEDNIKRFDYPGERAFTKAFCKDCGSALPYINEAGTALVIPAGSLDQSPKITPQENIFWDDKAEWFEAGVNAEKHAGF